MRERNKYLFCLIALAIAVACKKPYLPPQVAAPKSALVVEGAINAGSDSTFIKLSRTAGLNDTTTIKPEAGASVSVTGESSTYALTEIRPGVYASDGLNLDKNQKYSLAIRTANGKEYRSDAVEVKITPPIDSVSYNVRSSGVNINVSTHDPLNNTHYYRWDYDETWRFHTKYISEWRADGDKVVYRGIDGQVYYCFANDTSSTIVLGTTTKLAQDVVSNLSLTQIKATSEKISVRYSIKVRQYALTKESYQFWENLKKNTEELGSIFDALPSESIGNIHCTSDPTEVAVGFIDVCTVTSKRIFIDESQLPNYQTQYPYDCTMDSVYYNHDGVDEVASNILSGIYVPLRAIYAPTGTLIGYQRSSAECSVCTLRGRIKQPSFWK